MKKEEFEYILQNGESYLEESGSVQPQFEFGDFYTIKFIRERVEPEDTNKDLVNEAKDLGKDLEKDLENSLSKNEYKILNLLKANPRLTIEDLSKSVLINERNIRKNIEKLKNKKLLKRIGPDKGGHWEVINDESSQKE